MSLGIAKPSIIEYIRCMGLQFKKWVEALSSVINMAGPEAEPQPSDKGFKEPDKEGSDHGTKPIDSVSAISTPVGGKVKEKKPK